LSNETFLRCEGFFEYFGSHYRDPILCESFYNQQHQLKKECVIFPLQFQSNLRLQHKATNKL
jgi:hypothetical protein